MHQQQMALNQGELAIYVTGKGGMLKPPFAQSCRSNRFAASTYYSMHSSHHISLQVIPYPAVEYV